MKTIIRTFTAALAAAALLAVTTASAELVSYHVIYSGAAYDGNGATAEGDISLDYALFSNPGDSSSAIAELSLTVTGATLGNGTFTLADFSGYHLFINEALVENTEWVGQPQPLSGTTWGDWTLSGTDGNDLNFFSDSPVAPTAANFFVLGANHDQAERMALVSVTPNVPSTAGELKVGVGVSNVTQASVASLRPAAINAEGKIFLSTKLKGGSGTSIEAPCLLSWDHLNYRARALVRGGAEAVNMAGFIKSFGDPVVNGGNLLFKAKTFGIADFANEMIASVGQSGGASSLIGLLRKGDDAGIPGGFHFTKFDWFSGAPVANGAFIGAQILDGPLDGGGTNIGAGCWFSDGFTVTPIVYTGGPVIVDFATKTVKSVSKPTVSAPAQAVGRVGYGESISLLIKTVEGDTLIKTFDAPTPFGPRQPHGPYGPRKH